MRVQIVQQLQQLDAALPSVAQQPLGGQGTCLMHACLAEALISCLSWGIVASVLGQRLGHTDTVPGKAGIALWCQARSSCCLGRFLDSSV